MSYFQSAYKSSQIILFLFGILVLQTIATQAFAQLADTPGLAVPQGDYRIFEMSARLFDLIEGNLGALIMVVAGLAAIISAAFGIYRTAISLLIVAVGAFILRSLVEIFFNFE